MKNDLNNNLKPFLRWAGGKTWVKKTIDEIIKDDFKLKKINNYHEPFLGAGAVFFHIDCSNAIISDLNNELINTYLVIKENLDDLFNELNLHQINHSEKYYYEVRSWDRENDFFSLSNVKRAGRFLYLNKACFNGLYRVNNQGYFNVPIGFSKNTNIVFDFENLVNISNFLKEKNLKIITSSFEEIIKNVKKNDLVYFDPPYYKDEKSTAFTKYTKNDFTEKEHILLREVCDKIVKKGAYVILSNSDTKFIRDLFLNSVDNNVKYGYKHREVKVGRPINSKVDKRKKISELLIYNVKK